VPPPAKLVSSSGIAPAFLSESDALFPLRYTVRKLEIEYKYDPAAKALLGIIIVIKHVAST
jgi:hypothetical protein